LLEQKNLQGNNMSYINNGVFNHQKWQRDQLSEGPGNDPMLKSLRTRVQGEKFPDLKVWWEYEPSDIMTYVYWHQGQLPPTGTQFDKEWTNIVKQLHAKYPIPADVLPSVDLDRDAMDAIMHDVPRAESVDRATMTEALARGLKPLLMLGSKVKWTTMSEDALLDLSDKFDQIDDEQADDIASHLNMSIELKQDGSAAEARAWMKKFNKACADALSGKSVKSAFEGVNEAPMASGPMVQGKAFQPGDMWSEDFDYVGMLKFGATLEIPEGGTKYMSGITDPAYYKDILKPLYESFTDVNYQT